MAAPPIGFSTQEYAAYDRCITKIAVGDTVLGYCRQDHNRRKRPSPTVSDMVLTATVIAIHSVRRNFILGTNEEGTTLWKQRAEKDVNYDIWHPDHRSFVYGWHVESVRDIRIAKIIKAVPVIEPVVVSRR